MSSVSYNTPPCNQRVAAEVNTYLRLIDENMQNAGLIRQNVPAGTTVSDTFGSQGIVEYNSTAFESYYAALAVKQTNYWYQTQYLCTMEYRLPTGNGKVIIGDDPENIGYKKITRASYDSTEVIIRFNFFWNSVVDGNQATSSINHRFIICYPSIFAKDYTYIANTGTGYLFAPNYSVSSYNVTMTMEGKSYISLTQDHLTVAIGCHLLGGLQYGSNNFRRYMINFSIYRKDDNIYIYGVNGGATSSTDWYDYWRDDRSDIVLWSYNPRNNKTTSWYNRDLRFLYWPIGTSIAASTIDRVISSKVYTNNDYNEIQQVHQLTVTRFLDTNPRELKIVYRLNNNLILGNYVNLGLSERAQCPVDRSSKNYSWAFLHDEKTVYTTDLL